MRDRRRLHNKTFSRAVSLLLGLLLCLEPLSVVALAATSGNIPAVKTTYKPTVVVEGNAVVTGVAEGEEPTADDLTGFFEVALKVQTAAYVDGDGKQVSYEAYAADPDAYEKKDDIDFGVVAAALKYDASIFTPVSWSATEEIFDPDTGKVLAGAAGLTDISALATDGFASLDAIGPEEMIDGEAVIFESDTANEYILNLSAWAKREHVRYDEPTAVVVVRFAYNKSERPMLTKDTESGQYVLGADNRPTTKTVLWLATDEEANDSDSDQSVWYDGDHYDPDTLTPRDAAYYYYVASEVGATTPATTPSTKGNVDVTYVDAAGATKTATILDPNTVGKKVLSLYYPPSGAAPSSDPPSYLDNVLSQGLNGADYASLVFDFVNAPSFLTSGVDLGDLSVIIFVDWDNTILGTLVVTKETDIRERVNSYVATHLVHPSLNAPTDPSLLTRVASYRGKYPTTPMSEAAGAGDKSVDPEGENYPLTNKLDYVFFKRPMEFVDTDTDTIADTWQQMGTTDTTGTGATTATWDDKYPFIYGWASCTLENFEDTWTTLGMGELADYSGSSIGGYNDIGTAPATFTYDSDALTFQFLDCKEGVATDVVVAKAVYEPGVDLLSREFTYRMVAKPYYNKLNSAAANVGGAYSVDLTYERSFAYSDGIRGVARIREPVLRQNTTTDVKWEAEDLVNPTLYEAYSSKTKTTYTKVDVENTEQISFTLVLSGRQNRVDYFLTENYQDNFIAGGERSATNEGHRLTDVSSFVVDNYNYSNSDSVTDDEYYDAPYEYRDGTHGFVLYGTLNNLMEVATKQALDPAYTQLNTYAGTAVLADANLRLPDGTAPSTYDDRVLMVAKITAAAQAAIDAHDAGIDDYWNVEKNCAELTYHQLQLYIVNDTLLDRAAADAVTITWCHLHAECAANLVNTPKTWKDLMNKAAAGTSTDLSDIAMLSTNDLEALSHLRSDSNGGGWSTAEDFAAALSEAVNILVGFNDGMDPEALTWDMVQYTILTGQGIKAENAPSIAAESYWWYDGAVSPTITWEELIASAVDAVAGVTLPNGATTAKLTLPDGTEVDGRDAKLNRALAAFTANASADGTDPAWITATHNLAQTANGEKFDDLGDLAANPDDFVAQNFAAFKDAVKAAVTAALNTGESQDKMTWEKIQYHVLNSEYLRYPSDDKTAEMAAYWWKDGGTKIIDLESLMTAVVNKDDLRLGLLTQTEITEVLNLRAFFNGKEFADSTDSTASAALAAVAADYLEALRAANGLTSLNAVLNGDYISQDGFQYFIFHGVLPGTLIVAEREAKNYYWWSYDSAQVTVTIPTDDLDDLAGLLEAAYRAGVNGYIADAEKDYDGAWDLTFTDTSTKVTDLRFYKGDKDENGDPITERSKLPTLTMAEFKTKMEGLARLTYTSATTAEADEFTAYAFDASKLDWYTVQFYLINGRLPVEGDADDQAEMDGYWWREKDSSTEVVLTLLDLLNAAVEKAVGGDSSELTAFATVENLGESGLSFKVTNLRTKSFIDGNNSTRTLASFNTCINRLVTTLSTSTYWDAANKKLTPLTWYQYQHAVYATNNGLVAPDSPSMATYTWAPDWVPASAASLSVMSLRPTVYEDQYTSETTVSEDGLTTTVTETLGTWNADLGDYDWTITTTVTQQVGETTVTTITVTTMTYDPETWQPIFDTTTQTLVTTPEAGDATYGLEEDTDLTPVQPEDSDSQTPEESAPAADDETQTATGGDQTYQPGADTLTTPVETTDEAAADSESADESESETGAVSAASAGLLSLAWRTNGTGPGISLAPAGPVATLRVTGCLDTGQLFGSQRDGPLGILPSRSNLPTVPALLANRRIRT